MENNLIPFIPHDVDGNIIQQRARDGYINATAMCQAAGKKMSHYMANQGTKDFLQELLKETKLTAQALVVTMAGGSPDLQGSWVHPQVAIHLAQWLSPRFAVQVSRWVFDWLSGGEAPGSKMPVHLQRYMVNRTKIPVTHFSMLNELTFALIAPMETDGYTLPENMVPDISEGRMFSQWLRENGIDPSTFPKYKHRYTDGRVIDARLYPNEYLADFRTHFHAIWMPTKAEQYFRERDPKALPFLPKLLADPDK